METWRMTALFVMAITGPERAFGGPNLVSFKLGKWIERDGSVRAIIHGQYRQYVDEVVSEYWIDKMAGRV